MSPTRLRGPHDWTQCPRRSPEPISRTRSAPSSPGPRPHSPAHTSSHPHLRGATLPNQVPLDVLRGTKQLERMDPTLCSPSKSVPDARPPFVVRHADDSLLGERNFCGKPINGSNKVYYAERHKGISGGSGLRSGRGDERVKTGTRFISGETGIPTSCSEIKYSPKLGQRSPCVSPTPKSTPSSLRQSALGPRVGHTHSPHGSPQWGRSDDLVTKYLETPPGDRGCGYGSLAEAIEDKIERLKRECCECLVSNCIGLQ